MAALAAGAWPPAQPPPMITGEWSPRKWEACEVQLMCDDAREYRERMGEMQSNVGSMTIDGGTTWIQIVMHGAGAVGENRIVPTVLVGGANGGNTTLADRDGWYWYINANGDVAKNPGGIEAYLTLAAVPAPDRVWIKACILGAYTKFADQEMKVMLARDAEMVRQEMEMANSRYKTYLLQGFSEAVKSGDLAAARLLLDQHNSILGADLDHLVARLKSQLE